MRDSRDSCPKEHAASTAVTVETDQWSERGAPACPLRPELPLAKSRITFDALCLSWHNWVVAWEVEGTDEFAEWFVGLSDEEQVSVGRVVDLLVEHGLSLPFPYSSGIPTSRHRHMRELRIQHQG